MLYLTEGDYINAGLSALSIIPGADAFTKTGKASKVLGNGIVESGLKHLDNVADGIKKLVKKADDAIDLEKHLPKKLLTEEAETFAKKADKVADDVVEDAAKAIKSGTNSIIKNGKVSIDDLKANPSVFSGKSVDEIAQALTDAGYDVTVKTSTRSRSGAQIIKINNPGGGKNISQVQVSPGGGRHGSNPYVKISTTDQGIIKIVNGSESIYKTDGKETATIIFSGGN